MSSPDHDRTEKQPPRVSICCAWYNRADQIPATIDSLLAQSGETFEIVVVNDGSSDPRVKEQLESYRDHRLKVVHQDNCGFVHAIRRAIDESVGEFIAIQGAGDLSFPDRIQKQARLLAQNPDFAAVGCRYVNVTVGDGRELSRAPGKPAPLNPTLKDFLAERNPFSHGEVMFRRSVYLAVGGYRTFFKFAQDRDLWIRMAEAHRFGVVDEVLYERRMFMSDGISYNRSHVLLQGALSAFARQCHYDRRKNGRDFIDMYGNYAGVFRKRSDTLADVSAVQALQAFSVGDAESAKFFARVGLAEGKTKLSLIAFLVVSLSSHSRPLEKLFRRLLRTRQSERWNKRPA